MDKKTLPNVDNPPISDDQQDSIIEPEVITRPNLREAIQDVYMELGGNAALKTWVQASTANKRLFYKDILPKVIPKQTEVTGAGGGAIRMEVTWSDDQTLDLRNSHTASPAKVLQLMVASDE